MNKEDLYPLIPVLAMIMVIAFVVLANGSPTMEEKAKSTDKNFTGVVTDIKLKEDSIYLVVNESEVYFVYGYVDKAASYYDLNQRYRFYYDEKDDEAITAVEKIGEDE